MILLGGFVRNFLEPVGCRQIADGLCVCARWQAAKTRALQHAYRRAEAKHPRENAPRAGAIRNLGLLDKGEDTKEALGTK